ncbi:MAG: Ig-like domain-containing protein [Bacteroidales bacterium]|nr:Ig-like domain-containing protein [Bacteroidales bacterium]MCL2738234.1 Ig-like domain-containing protein [Bacteroidales bacterium]
MKKLCGLLIICLLIGCNREEEKVSAIFLDPQTLGLRVTDTYRFNVLHEPADLPAPEYQWSSSNTAVATVSATGILTAVGQGNTTVTVVLPGRSLMSACEVQVAAQLATHIYLNKEHLVLEESKSETLSYTFAPNGSVVSDAQWNSSDETVAVVDGEGKVTAMKVGQTVITVFDLEKPEVKASCTVVVTPKLAESIVLDLEEVTLRYQGEATLGYTVFPEGVELQRPFWSSANPDIVSVNQSGVIKGLSPGATVVTILDEANHLIIAHCSVTVLEENATSIELNPFFLNMMVDDEYTITYRIFPENTTDEVVWFSDNEAVATVDAFGKVTAIEAGTCTITLQVVNGTLASACRVTVIRPISSIHINQEAVTMRSGNTYSLQASYLPVHATPPAAYYWSSSDPWVATVDQQGVVTAQRIGEAIIRVEVPGGMYRECTITVNPVYNSWNEPVLLFLGAQSDIRNAERRSLSALNATLTAFGFAGQAMVYDGETGSRLQYCVYTFTSDYMTAALLAFADNDNTAVAAARGYCAERYKFVSESGGITVYQDRNGAHIEVGFRNLTDYVGITALQLALIGLKNRWFIISYAL